MSRKNKWRTQGAIQFKRETRRYHDGEPCGGDVLFIRIKGKACVFALTEPEDSFIRRPGKIWANDGLYLCNTPVKVAKLLRAALHHRAENNNRF